jgi:hypothetical protein
VLRSRLLRRVVVEPEVVVRAILRALDRNRGEVFVPGFYRAAALAQALAPGLLGRLLGRGAYRPAARD